MTGYVSRVTGWVALVPMGTPLMWSWGSGTKPSSFRIRSVLLYGFKVRSTCAVVDRGEGRHGHERTFPFLAAPIIVNRASRRLCHDVPSGLPIHLTRPTPRRTSSYWIRFASRMYLRGAVAPRVYTNRPCNTPCLACTSNIPQITRMQRAPPPPDACLILAMSDLSLRVAGADVWKNTTVTMVGHMWSA